jgi:hypothetical protein
MDGWYEAAPPEGTRPHTAALPQVSRSGLQHQSL